MYLVGKDLRPRWGVASEIRDITICRGGHDTRRADGDHVVGQVGSIDQSMGWTHEITVTSPTSRPYEFSKCVGEHDPTDSL